MFCISHYAIYAFDTSSNGQVRVPNVARYLAICLSRFDFGTYQLCAKSLFNHAYAAI